MKKTICLFVMMFGLLLSANAQLSKWSDFLLNDITTTTKMVGLNDSAGLHKNRQFKLPFTFRAADSSVTFPMLGGYNGLVLIDSNGRIKPVSYNAFFLSAIDTEIVISNTGVSPGSVDVDIAYSTNKLLGGLIIGVGLVVNAPNEFATPPARTAWPIITVSGVNMIGGFSAPIASTSGTGLMPMFGSIGYVSTIEFRWVYSFMTGNSTLYAYMVKPTGAVTDYEVSFKIFLPI